MQLLNYNCQQCGAQLPGARPGTTVICRFCGGSTTIAPMPTAAAPHGAGGHGGGYGGHGAGGHAGPAEAPLPSSGPDPLPSMVTSGVWQSVREGHELVPIGTDRVLDWEPATGRYNVWAYDMHSSGDPLPSALASGTWGSIRGDHQLIALGTHRILDWEPSSGAYRLWVHDPDARGAGDILPSVAASGIWRSIQAGKSLVAIGDRLLLEWEPSSGQYRLWAVELNASGTDPLPGPPLTQGAWRSIGAGHELIAIGRQALLDWTPSSGNFRLWSFDERARDPVDPLPSQLACGNWESIRQGHRLIPLAGQRILDWEPQTGAYRLWNCSTG